MCGRTSLFAPAADLRERFDATVPEEYRPRYNIAPTEPVEVVRNETADRIDRVRWGLLPEWADADDEGFINARAETAAEKPAFSDAWESRPCLVLSSGFYDWKTVERGSKQPYRFHREGAVAFAMAGLWERRETDDGTLDTVTVLTTEPNEVVEPIHHRMPVILPRDEEETWLMADPDERETMCRPYPGDDLAAYPVSTAVNDPTNDSPSIVEPDESEQSGLGEFAG